MKYASRREVLRVMGGVALGGVLGGARAARGREGTMILGIKALPDEIEIAVRGKGRVRIGAGAVYAEAGKPGEGNGVWEGEVEGERTISIQRFSANVDRMFWKFWMMDGTPGKTVGAQRFVEEVELERVATRLRWPKSIKGVSCPVDIADLAELGVRHTHINLNAAAMVDAGDAARDEEFSRVVDGKRVWLNREYVRRLDRSVRELTEAGINAVGVITNHIRARGVLTHPKSDLERAPNRMGAFNLTNEDGVRHYRAMMEFLAERYCRGAKEHGSVGGWIIGNELDNHWIWHNMGAASLEEVTRQYVDELRIAWLAVRNAGADVPVFASFDHFWTISMTADEKRSLPGKKLIDAMAALSEREGNFPWHVAHHPYPENLFEPRFWNDKSATHAMDTPRVTFKNVEVLAAYLRRAEMTCAGKARRLILSEQGFHAGDTTESEQVQAAAYALAYRRLAQIPAVEAFILHRHVDADEGGLKLGIWTQGAARRKRKIWEVVGVVETEKWRKVCEFALPIVGMKDWSEVKVRDEAFD